MSLMMQRARVQGARSRSCMHGVDRTTRNRHIPFTRSTAVLPVVPGKLQKRCRGLKLAAAAVAAAAASPSVLEERLIKEDLYEGYWLWNGYKIRYQRSGDEGPAVLLVHGFGGNCDHWRKNTPELGRAKFRAFSIDLLGYGYSDKPDPRSAAPNTIYCFETWGQQLVSFVTEVIQEPTVISCNSVGGLAGLQASIIDPDNVKGVQLIDISLRGLHVKRQPAWQRPFVAAFQRLLRETDVGRSFFASVAKPQSVKNILSQAYGVKAAVTDELVDCILKPGLQPGAVDVFLDFISYSGGPLPEELLEKTTVPVSMLWGERDPWEDIKLGKQLLSIYPCVKEFVPLPGLGHCPQDEAPEVVNPLIAKFVQQYHSSEGGAVMAPAGQSTATAGS